MEKGVLAKGLKFAPAPKRIPVPEIVAAVEEGLKRSGSTQTQQARTRIAGLLVKSRPPPSKVHKTGAPFRPIVSFIGSPTYCLSKHLVSILSPLVGKSESFVRNSADFSSFIAGQTLSPEMVLVSFDVVSLFTKVPTTLAVRVASDRLKADPSLPERTALSPAVVTRLLTFCLDATYLCYRGE